MFNLLVSAAPGNWESSQRMSIAVGRFGEMSGEAINRISTSNPESLRALEHVPALLMYETEISESYAESVRVGHLREIRLENSMLTFRFAEMGKIPRARLFEQRFRAQIEDFAFRRTHWAVKDGNIPQDVMAYMSPTPKQYDVVLSFAGEDRGYVEAVAQILADRGVEVFYDKFEETTLWGKDLAVHFDQLYRLHARYCVMFISKHYADKVWTRHEAAAALARAMLERVEYVLPARFDTTDIPGLRPTVGYADLSILSPEQLAERVMQKLGLRPSS
jgi:hypothetical protein